METLNRFLQAQEHSYSRALAEIKAGKKQSHWMWYIFPQIQGLGYSEISKKYAIKNLQEAKNYLQNEILGERLVTMAQLLLAIPQTNAHAVFGSPDDMKLKSSMTLFAMASERSNSIYKQVLDKFFNGEYDKKTLYNL